MDEARSDSALVAHEVSLLNRYLREYLAPQGANEDIVSMQAVVDSAAGTAADKVSLGPPRTGTQWYVQRASSEATAGTPTFSLFVGPKDNTDGTYRRDFAAAALVAQRDYFREIYVGPGEYLVVAWGGATGASRLKAGLQVRVRRIDAPGQL
jgi:hypothetical protein